MDRQRFRCDGSGKQSRNRCVSFNADTDNYANGYAHSDSDTDTNCNTYANYHSNSYTNTRAGLSAFDFYLGKLQRDRDQCRQLHLV